MAWSFVIFSHNVGTIITWAKASTTGHVVRDSPFPFRVEDLDLLGDGPGRLGRAGAETDSAAERAGAWYRR